MWGWEDTGRCFDLGECVGSVGGLLDYGTFYFVAGHMIGFFVWFCGLPAFGLGSVVADLFVCFADVWAWVICFCFCGLQAFGVGLIVVCLFLWFASVWG